MVARTRVGTVKENSTTTRLAELMENSAVYQTISCVFRQDKKYSVVSKSINEHSS